jgi:hypothetical protein
MILLVIYYYITITITVLVLTCSRPCCKRQCFSYTLQETHFIFSESEYVVFVCFKDLSILCVVQNKVTGLLVLIAVSSKEVWGSGF